MALAGGLNLYGFAKRRVWVWSRKQCFNYSADSNWRLYVECITSLMRRTVWNGDQELVEIQMPGGSSADEVALYENDVNATALPLLPNCVDRMQYFGRVFYVPGRAVDKPLAVTRVNYEDQHYESEGHVFCAGTAAAYRLLAPMTVMPFWNRHGDATLGAYTDGGRVTACLPPSQTIRCVTPIWSFFFSAYNRERGNERTDWHGTMLESKRDETGLSYSRYRYYDPATGRFTQEDPIGLAGGINLYGFAGGDPVNFADPFGLCPEPEKKNGTVCIALFIERENVGGLRGDHRGFSSSSDPSRSRVFLHVDVENQTFSATVNPTCSTGGECAAPLSTNEIGVTFGERWRIYGHGEREELDPAPSSSDQRVIYIHAE